MSRSLTITRRLLTAVTLAGAIAAIVAAQALAAVPSGTGPDAWYPYAVSYAQSPQGQVATPVSDVASSLQVARHNGGGATVSIVSDTANSLSVSRRNASGPAVRA